AEPSATRRDPVAASASGDVSGVFQRRRAPPKRTRIRRESTSVCSRTAPPASPSSVRAFRERCRRTRPPIPSISQPVPTISSPKKPKNQ
ncbi:unnamed protein product, partial [Nesidiocoris tenuis]